MDRLFFLNNAVNILDDLNHANHVIDLKPNMSEKIFFEEFRFSKKHCSILIDHVYPHIQCSHRFPAVDAILTTLQWLGTGNYMWNLRGVAGSSKTAVCRNVWKIIDSLTAPTMLQEWVSWPIDNKINEHVEYFRTKYNLPRILGVVDGTHIPILSPSSDPFEPAYVNRKGFHSMNVQIVCGANYKIIHADISSVGSTHDARVWDESTVPRLIQQSGYSLLGDSAYPCRWYLLTPYTCQMRNNLNRQQQYFQRRLVAARQNVEQTIGILKQRFHILKRPARYELTKTPKVVMACCVLHNICRHFNIPVTGDIHREDQNLNPNVPVDNVGNAVRQDYINRYIHV